MNALGRASGWIWVLLFWAVTSEGLCAQTAILLLRSATTGAPLADAVVVWEIDGRQQGRTVSGADGLVQLRLPQPVVVHVFCNGYQAYSDSLFPGQHRMLRLQPMVINLAELVVTGQHRVVPASESVLQVEVLHREEMELRQAQNLAEVVAYELWARMARDEVLGSNASINGISGQNIKILINGMPVAGRENGHIDLGQLNLEDVERIEIIEGPMSVLYGTDALGGVVNVIMREPPDSSYRGQVRFYTETVGTFNVAASGGGRIGAHAFTASAGRNFFSGYPNADQVRHQLWKPELQYFGSFAYHPQLGAWRLALRTDAFHEEIRNMGEPVITPYQAYAFDDYYYVRRFGQALDISRKFENEMLWELQGSLSDYQRKKYAYRKNLVDLTLQERDAERQINRMNEYVMRSSLSGLAWQERISWQAGVDVQQQQASGDRLASGMQQQTDLSLFASAEYQVTSDLRLRPGIRLAHNPFGVPLTPALHAHYDLSRQIHVRAGVARGFRAPSLKERYLNFFDSNHSIYGNPDLQAEQSFSANLFWLWEQQAGPVLLNTEVSLAYNNIFNQINLTLVNALEQLYTYINIGTYRTRTAGLRTEVHWKSLRADGGILLQAIAHHVNDSLHTDGFLFAPEYRIQVTGGDPSRHVQAMVTLRRTAPMPAFSLDAAGAVYERVARPYELLDISCSRHLFRGLVAVFAGINNLFNVRDVPNLSAGSAIHSSKEVIPVAIGRYGYLGVKLNVSK